VFSPGVVKVLGSAKIGLKVVSEVLFASDSPGVVKAFSSAVTGLNVVVISAFLFFPARKLLFFDLKFFGADRSGSPVELSLVPFVPFSFPLPE
jgi:hypothetical protein